VVAEAGENFGGGGVLQVDGRDAAEMRDDFGDQGRGDPVSSALHIPC